MSVATLVALACGAVALGGIGAFAGYGPLLRLLAGSRPDAVPPAGHAPTLSVLVAVRNGAALVEQKIENTLALDYPGEVQLLLTDDGSDDDTVARIERYAGRVELVTAPGFMGKAAALNRALPRCRGEIVVLTDVDALLSPDALRHLAAPFSDPAVGGVCGQRVLQRENAGLREAQAGYIGFDSNIKRLESRIGSITSNDGKLYAVRRELMDPIAEGTTDDLYSALNVIGKGRRFVFAPGAVAAVRTPSRSAGHELGRRRRIVCRSLTGMWMHRALFNPLRYGFFSYGLLVNKVVRRLLPLCLLLLFIANALVASRHPLLAGTLAVQGAAYLGAAAYPWLGRWLPGRLGRLHALAFYFVLGMAGTLLGVWDFITAKRVVKWEPRKADPATPRRLGDG